MCLRVCGYILLESRLCPRCWRFRGHLCVYFRLFVRDLLYTSTSAVNVNRNVYPQIDTIEKRMEDFPKNKTILCILLHALPRLFADRSFSVSSVAWIRIFLPFNGPPLKYMAALKFRARSAQHANNAELLIETNISAVIGAATPHNARES